LKLFLYLSDFIVPLMIFGIICYGITMKIPVDISHILGNLITVIFNYQILRKPLKILSL